MSRRHILTLDLHDDADLIAEYERHHAPGAVWPEIIASIRTQGIEDMRIYRLDTRLVMVMDVTDGFDFAAKARADAANPAVGRWEALMARFQKVADDGGKWREMTEIFALGAADQPSSSTIT